MWVQLLLGDPLILSDPSFGDLNFDFDWNNVDLEMEIADMLNIDPNEKALRPSPKRPANLRQSICMPTYTIPQTPTWNVRSLDHRPRLETRVQRTAGLIIHTLKSYPRMMLQHNSLPPFIHQHVLRSHDGDDDQEPLVNCINLVHMISSGYQGSRKLFWKNVRLECEQIVEQASHSNKFGGQLTFQC